VRKTKDKPADNRQALKKKTDGTNQNLLLSKVPEHALTEVMMLKNCC